MGVIRVIRVVIVSMYEKVIERLLWNTVRHEYLIGVKEFLRMLSFGSV